MDERTWLSSTNAYELLTYRPCRNDRKRRLSACASIRRVIHLVDIVAFHDALQVAERLADGSATNSDRVAARKVIRAAWDQWRRTRPLPDYSDSINSVMQAVQGVLEIEYKDFKLAIERAEFAEMWIDRAPEQEESIRAKHCDLVRDIFGNPFRPVTLDPRWLTSTVLDLARIIYDERTFERMPILADALMDAGCDSEEILSHCRNGGPHVRGCWVIDLLLANE